MKKLMTWMLALSFLVGTAAVFAQDKPADSKTTEKSKGKKKGGKKKKDNADKTNKKS